MRVRKSLVLLIVSLQLWLVNILFLLNSDPFYLRSMLLLIFMVIGLGLLFLLPWHIKKIHLAELIVYSIGISIVMLMLVGLISNTVFNYLGFVAPLSAVHLLIVLDLLSILLLIINFCLKDKGDLFINPIVFTAIDWVYFVIPPLFPILSVIGAVTLNNFGSEMYTMLLLAAIGMYVSLVVLFRRTLAKGLFPWILFNCAFALLLMTSLRGWYVTGHDNQLEYFVFRLTHEKLFWDISTYRDPYNASLSITILPTVFASLLPVSPVYVYKLIFQMLFANIAVSAYMYFRRFASSILSFLAVFVFVSFPSFIGDMPMLNRQEIALFLFSLLLLVIYSRSLGNKLRYVLFVFLGFGMALAHYSTTYITIVLFAVAYVIGWIINQNYRGLFSRMNLTVNSHHLRLWMVLVLMGFTYFWNVEITNTAGGVQRVFSRAVESVEHIFSDEATAHTIMYSLFNWNTETDELTGYIRQTEEAIRDGRDQDAFYPQELVDAYPIVQVAKETVPKSFLGKILTIIGIDVYQFNYWFRQIAAKLIQVLILVGFVSYLWRRKSKADNGEYLALVAASILWIGLFLSLPLLSVEYGTQRLFQQMLLVLGLPIVVGLQWVFRYISKQHATNMTGLVFVILFLSLSGFIPQLTGGYYPQLHLNNRGVEYDSYYTHSAEVASALWLKNQYDQEVDVYSADATRSRLAAISGVFSYHSILPSVIRRDAYVFVDYSTVRTGIANADYNGDLFHYTYPFNFLDENKDLVYSNNGSRIYK